MIKKNRSFGLVVGGILITYTVGQYFLKGKNSPVLAGIGPCLLLLAWLKPYWLSPLQILWEKVGFIMGVVNTYILLTVFYYFVLSPIATLHRLLVKQRRRSNRDSTSTYWQESPSDTNDHFKNQY
ncbi:hypothetical protein BEL04_01415 [Mucilaginibacter sp. PPCGB 2223]|nr:hypothetical protein BEL04_01415 [Mucilaginibacter sp. PPCGB 2223]